MVKRVGTPTSPKYLRELKIEKTAMPSITKKMEPYNITGFSPLGMTNLDLWLDGNDPTTMYNASTGGANVVDGGFIYRWQDKSGNANHVWPVLGVNNYSAPQYKAGVTNGLGIVTMSNTVMSNQRQAPYPLDVYMVVTHCNYNNLNISGISNKNENLFCVKYPGGSFGSNKDWNSLAYSLFNSQKGLYYTNKWYNNSSNYSRTCNVVPTEAETSMGFLMLNWGISNSDYYIKRYTRTLAETTSYTSWTTYANSNTSFRYFVGGIDYSATDSNFNGSICEILSFSNLLNYSNRTLVESYLANKWGLQANIPISHPGHLGNLPTTIGYSLETTDGVHGYSNKAKGTLVYIQPPDAPIANTPTISNSASLLSVAWGDTGNGGVSDYYNFTICNSTDDSTYSAVLSINYSKAASYIYNSLTLDDKYYKYSVQAFNAGGCNVATSASIKNSVPGTPTLTTPLRSGNSLQLSWTGAARALSYAVTLYYSTDQLGYSAIYTNSISFTTITIPAAYTSVSAFNATMFFKYTIVAFNGSGQNPAFGTQPFTSAVYHYPPDNA
jgi:hypothetical protein